MLSKEAAFKKVKELVERFEEQLQLYGLTEEEIKIVEGK